MRTILFLFIVAASGCTKPNPNLCCTDETDCATAGIPVGTTCAEGLICRGNQCIAEVCETRDQCDASAPYCVGTADGRCQESCTDDSQCPGFGQSAAQLYCQAGDCVACRGSTDCTIDAPVCADGTCRGCRDHDECNTGVCASDGTCASEAEIAHVALTGSTSADCSVATPCSTVERALQLTPARRYILLEAGTYTRTAALSITGKRSLIGRSGKPVLTRANDGAVIEITGGSGIDVTLDNVEVSGAKGPDSFTGAGIRCVPTSGSPVVRLRRAIIRANNATGIEMRQGCSLDAVASTISSNGRIGISITDGVASIDRCTIVQNGAFAGVALDVGTFTVTNSVVARNVGNGIELFNNASGAQIEHNTIVDNTGVGFNCSLPGVSGTFPNNIIARNATQVAGSSCSYPSSIIVDTDITAIKFVSPNTAPFDYHLTSGSVAVDVATPSAIDEDIDGDARPQGAGRDVGADELGQ